LHCFLIFPQSYFFLDFFAAILLSVKALRRFGGLPGRLFFLHKKARLGAFAGRGLTILKKLKVV
jgi:hypothetical protein